MCKPEGLCALHYVVESEWKRLGLEERKKATISYEFICWCPPSTYCEIDEPAIARSGATNNTYQDMDAFNAAERRGRRWPGTVYLEHNCHYVHLKFLHARRDHLTATAPKTTATPINGDHYVDDHEESIDIGARRIATQPASGNNTKNSINAP